MRITTKKTAKRNPARIGYIYFLKYIMSNRFLDINSDTACSSSLPIDIVIPVAEKDAMVLPLVVQSIKAFVRHPINKFYVISPHVEEVGPYLESHQIEYFTDEEILDRPTSFFDFKFNGVDRSGWLKQQFIKLAGDRFCEMEHYLVVDSDTVFVRPLVFFHRDRYVMHVSKAYHRPYYELFSRLLGYRRISSLSFISHHMLFNKTLVREMKKDIAAHTGLEWDEAVMKYLSHDTVSPFSEYETYGNYLFNKYPKRIVRLFHHGHDVDRPRQLPSLDEICHGINHGIRTISFHSY